jgi:hypothetical protein
MEAKFAQRGWRRKGGRSLSREDFFLFLILSVFEEDEEEEDEEDFRRVWFRLSAER